MNNDFYNDFLKLAIANNYSISYAPAIPEDQRKKFIEFKDLCEKLYNKQFTDQELPIINKRIEQLKKEIFPDNNKVVPLTSPESI